MAVSSQAIEERLSAAGIETPAIPDREPVAEQAWLLTVFQSRHGVEAGPAMSFEVLAGGFSAEPVEAPDEIQHPPVLVPSPPGLLASLSETG